MRIVLTYLVPLLLPTLLYLLWIRYRIARGQTGEPFQRSPLPWLVLAGVVLLALSVVIAALETGSSPASVYEPARLENGKVVPARLRPIEPKPKQGAETPP